MSRTEAANQYQVSLGSRRIGYAIDGKMLCNALLECFQDLMTFVGDLDLNAASKGLVFALTVDS